jgi:hypothetical protein
VRVVASVVYRQAAATIVSTPRCTAPCTCQAVTHTYASLEQQCMKQEGMCRPGTSSPGVLINAWCFAQGGLLCVRPPSVHDVSTNIALSAAPNDTVPAVPLLAGTSSSC